MNKTIIRIIKYILTKEIINNKSSKIIYQLVFFIYNKNFKKNEFKNFKMFKKKKKKKKQKIKLKKK